MQNGIVWRWLPRGHIGRIKWNITMRLHININYHDYGLYPAMWLALRKNSAGYTVYILVGVAEKFIF